MDYNLEYNGEVSIKVKDWIRETRHAMKKIKKKIK